MKRLETLLHFNALAKIMCGHSKMIDLFLSRLLLKIRYESYIDLCFYDVPWKERKKYILRDFPYALMCNPGVTRDNHDDKRDIMRKIYPYLKRKVVLDTSTMTKNEFITFCNDIDSFFYKPEDGDGGGGIQKYYLHDYEVDELYKVIKTLKAGVLEETICQHHVMGTINPDVVSSIRMTIYKSKNGAKLLFATLRTSFIKGSIVDNAGSGGCFASIDIDTGVVCRNAYAECHIIKTFTNETRSLISKKGMERHPLTGAKFIGFEIPCFKEATQMVLDIANNIDFYGRKLLGFDVAITENGPIVIEVNANRPGICELYQIARKDTPLKESFEKMFD